MKTSFSMKVTGSITVNIESNEDGGDDGGVATEDNDGGNVLYDALLAPYMKSLMNDAIKRYVRDKGTAVEEDGWRRRGPSRCMLEYRNI
jgi:hypothetical protein